MTGEGLLRHVVGRVSRDAEGLRWELAHRVLSPWAVGTRLLPVHHLIAAVGEKGNDLVIRVGRSLLHYLCYTFAHARVHYLAMRSCGMTWWCLVWSGVCENGNSHDYQQDGHDGNNADQRRNQFVKRLNLFARPCDGCDQVIHVSRVIDDDWA